MITPSSLAIILQGAPFPGATFTVTPGGAALDLTVEGVTITFCEGAWYAAERLTTAAHLSFAAIPTAEQVHTEIRRVLMVLKGITGASWVEVRADYVEPDLPTDDPLYDRAAAAQALAKVTAERADFERRIDALTAQHDDWQADIDRARRDASDATARAVKVEDRLRRDDELRSQLAIAVGLDGSASLALILDTVTRDRPGWEISRLSGLLDGLAAPVAFGERRLSTAERAEWALRRWLTEGKECSARMAQLIEAEVLLDCVGVPAYATVPSDDPGDASEALTLPERLRLHFGARS